MHPPLDRPHPECQEAIKALTSCHDTHPYSKFVGVCNQYKAALDICLKAEKETRRKNNPKLRYLRRDEFKEMKKQAQTQAQ